jgi:hypothetical protein
VVEERSEHAARLLIERDVRATLTRCVERCRRQ